MANLGWKLAGAVQGWGGAGLIDSYRTERRPIGLRNTSRARAFADSIGGYVPSESIEADGPAGEAARAHAGDYLLDHARREFNIPGITFGVRYDGSAIVTGDGSPPPEDVINDYRPNAIPGGRTPHLWLANGESLYDHLGIGFTLLRIDAAADTTRWQAAADKIGCPLKILDLSANGCAAEAATLYGAALALVRPDQHVAWRGDDAQAARTILARACGHA